MGIVFDTIGLRTSREHKFVDCLTAIDEGYTDLSDLVRSGRRVLGKLADRIRDFGPFGKLDVKPSIGPRSSAKSIQDVVSIIC
jgi:hypothetical protein